MRRNSPKVIWLPLTNANSVDAVDFASGWNIATFGTGTVPGDTTSTELPIVLDGQNASVLDAQAGLSTITGNAYRLRRIVGKLYVFVAQVEGSTGTYGITAGFIVRTTDPLTGGSQASSTGTSEIAPSHIDNLGDPWIWRRSWVLANNGDAGPTTIADIPGQNFGAQYPGSQEGPHIDQKTARLVAPEHRLFLDVSCTVLLGGAVVNPPQVVMFYELRVLGSLRSTIGNRRNASR